MNIEVITGLCHCIARCIATLIYVSPTDQLDKLQRRAIKIIDRGMHCDYTDKALENLYSLKPLEIRRKEHHLALMYRLRDIPFYVDEVRPAVVLRNRNKIKFKTPSTKLTKVLKSPFYRGCHLWDMLH